MQTALKNYFDMKELKEALEEIQELFIHEDYLNAEIKVDELLETLKKAKQKEAIEQSTNWQMKEEQPELSAEEFLRKKIREFKTSMSFSVNVSGHDLADLLTEFKNQKDNWISVEERLPTILDRVLIWHHTSINPSWGMYMGEKGKWCLVANDMSIIRNWIEGATNVKVTHWQPLPKPPVKK